MNRACIAEHKDVLVVPVQGHLRRGFVCWRLCCGLLLRLLSWLLRCCLRCSALCSKKATSSAAALCAVIRRERQAVPAAASIAGSAAFGTESDASGDTCSWSWGALEALGAAASSCWALLLLGSSAEAYESCVASGSSAASSAQGSLFAPVFLICLSTKADCAPAASVGWSLSTGSGLAVAARSASAPSAGLWLLPSAASCVRPFLSAGSASWANSSAQPFSGLDSCASPCSASAAEGL